MDNNKIWEEVLIKTRTKMTTISFTTWIVPLTIRKLDDTSGIAYLETDEGPVVKGVKRHLGTIEESFREVTGRSYRVIIKKKEDYEEENKGRNPSRTYFDAEKTLNPRLSFENFVVGNSNKYAHAASFAVAESPAEAYNPLFLYGGSGLGKTHLMQAIAIHILNNNPGMNVLYVSSEQFTNELITALSENKTKQFKNKYRKTDVLLIDDIQFLEGKESTQEEFFHTFETLFQENKQIVISSDRPPNNLVKIDERLRSRFTWNMIADLQPADFETRVAILRKKAENAGIEWTQDVYNVCCLISEQVTDNIRELEGAFNRVVGMAQLIPGEEVNVEFAKRILNDIIKDNEKAVAPERIRSMVARHYKIKVADMDSKKRNAEITLPRQVAMYICREETDLSLPKIGKLFGGRHYSTVIHSHEKVQELMKNDETFSNEISKLMEELKKN